MVHWKFTFNHTYSTKSESVFMLLPRNTPSAYSSKIINYLQNDCLINSTYKEIVNKSIMEIIEMREVEREKRLEVSWKQTESLEE